MITGRMLVTGSREWTDSSLLEEKLLDALFTFKIDTVVSGGCPTGADAMVEQYVASLPGQVASEVHPADWATHGKAAGPLRNQEMVDLGADVCLAFFREGAANRGTNDCVRRAEKANIPVVRVES